MSHREAVEKMYRIASAYYAHGRLSDEKVTGNCLLEIMQTALDALAPDQTVAVSHTECPICGRPALPVWEPKPGV